MLSDTNSRQGSAAAAPSAASSSPSKNAGGQALDFRQRAMRSMGGLASSTAGLAAERTAVRPSAGVPSASAGGFPGVSATNPSTSPSAHPLQLPVSGAGKLNRLEQLASLLSVAGFATRTCTEEADTLLILLEGEARFRLVAPQSSRFIMLVADVFTGSDAEIAQMAPSLLHANYTCQRLALGNPMQIFGLSDAALDDEDDEAHETPWLPVMGLDLHRMMVVLSLQIPADRLEEGDFSDFMGGLLETIAQDADTLVQQFRAFAPATA